MLICKLSTRVTWHERCCSIPWSIATTGRPIWSLQIIKWNVFSLICCALVFIRCTCCKKFYDSFHLKGPIMRCTLWSTLSKTIGNCANTWIQRSLNWFSPWDNRFYTVKPMPAGNIHFIHQLKVIYWKLPNNLLFSVSKFISLHFFINLAKPSNRPLFAVLNLLIKDTINSLNL